MYIYFFSSFLKIMPHFIIEQYRIHENSEVTGVVKCSGNFPPIVLTEHKVCAFYSHSGNIKFYIIDWLLIFRQYRVGYTTKRIVMNRSDTQRTNWKSSITIYIYMHIWVALYTISYCIQYKAIPEIFHMGESWWFKDIHTLNMISICVF